MDVDVIMDKDRKIFPGQGPLSMKHVLADIWVVKASELGCTEEYIHTKTHLGHLLKIGDSVLGYNLADSNINDPTFENLDREKIPDVILVRKHYGDKSLRSSARAWKLQHLGDEATVLETSNKYE